MVKKSAIQLLGISYSIFGYAGIGFDYIQSKINRTIYSNFISATENVNSLLDSLIAFDTYLKSHLASSITFWLVFLILDVLILLAVKETLNDPHYLSSQLQRIFGLFLIGIVFQFIFSIIRYSVFGVLYSDYRQLILKWQIVEEQAFIDFSTQWQNTELIFNSVEFLLMIFMFILSFFWFEWGNHILYPDLSRDNKKWLRFGFLLLIFGRGIRIIGSFFYILNAVIPNLWLDTLFSRIGIIVTCVAGTFIGSQLKTFAIIKESINSLSK